MSSVSVRSYTPARAVVDNKYALPLGLNARFTVHLHDDLGRDMDASSTLLNYRLTRYMESSSFPACIVSVFIKAGPPLRLF